MEQLTKIECQVRFVTPAFLGNAEQAGMHNGLMQILASYQDKAYKNTQRMLKYLGDT